MLKKVFLYDAGALKAAICIESELYCMEYVYRDSVYRLYSTLDPHSVCLPSHTAELNGTAFFDT